MYEVTLALAQGNLRYLINLNQLSLRDPREATRGSQESLRTLSLLASMIKGQSINDQGTEGQSLGSGGGKGPGVPACLATNEVMWRGRDSLPPWASDRCWPSQSAQTSESREGRLAHFGLDLGFHLMVLFLSFLFRHRPLRTPPSLHDTFPLWFPSALYRRQGFLHS